MPKTPHTFKLSEQTEQNIAAIRAKYPHLKDNTAVIEFALWLAARSEVSVAFLGESGLALKLSKAPAARPARPKAAKAKEQEQ